MLDTRDSITSPAHPPLLSPWNRFFHRRAVEFARSSSITLIFVIFAGRRGWKGCAVSSMAEVVSSPCRQGRERGQCQAKAF